MRPIVTDGAAWSVCLLFGLSVTIVSPAKTTEPIEMSFETWTRVGTRNRVFDGRGSQLPQEGQFQGEKGWPIL